MSRLDRIGISRALRGTVTVAHALGFSIETSKLETRQADVIKFGKVQTIWRLLSHAEF